MAGEQKLKVLRLLQTHESKTITDLVAEASVPQTTVVSCLLRAERDGQARRLESRGKSRAQRWKLTDKGKRWVQGKLVELGELEITVLEDDEGF